MNSDLSNYKQKLRKQLHCSITTKKKLLSAFEHSLIPFLEEYPSPTFAQLESAFGPPEEMASMLMESVSRKEQLFCLQKRKLAKLLVSILVVLVFLFSVYTYCIKEYTFIEVHNELFEGNIYETISTQKGS